MRTWPESMSRGSPAQAPTTSTDRARARFRLLVSAVVEVSAARPDQLPQQESLTAVTSSVTEVLSALRAAATAATAAADGDEVAAFRLESREEADASTESTWVAYCFLAWLVTLFRSVVTWVRPVFSALSPSLVTSTFFRSSTEVLSAVTSEQMAGVWLEPLAPHPARVEEPR